jgi:hypothetical protein
MRIAYNAQLTESLFLSRPAKRVFHAGGAFRKTRPSSIETENGVSIPGAHVAPSCGKAAGASPSRSPCSLV